MNEESTVVLGEPNISVKVYIILKRPDNVEWSSKKLWKMISAEVKANVKQWRTGACIL